MDAATLSMDLTSVVGTFSIVASRKLDLTDQFCVNSSRRSNESPSPLYAHVQEMIPNVAFSVRLFLLVLCESANFAAIQNAQ